MAARQTSDPKVYMNVMNWDMLILTHRTTKTFAKSNEHKHKQRFYNHENLISSSHIMLSIESNITLNVSASARIDHDIVYEVLYIH